jgi:hypothetical protein
MSGPMGGTFIDYNINVSDGSIREYEYNISDAEIFLSDSNNTNFPSGVKLTMYEQEEDSDGEWILGTKIKELFTDDKGRIVWQYPEGVYAGKLIGSDNQEQIFWDIEIIDERRELYYLKTQSGWLPDTGACEANSDLTIITSQVNGEKISGLKFSLHEETLDVDGNKNIGTKLVGGTIEESGKKTVQVNPDPRKKYALRIFDKNDDIGEFWFFDGFQFSCKENVVIEKTLPAFNVVLRSGDRELKKNQKFSIYTQKFDTDGEPIKEKQDLVADNLNTSNEGEYKLYLGPNTPYYNNKNGLYVFQSQSSGATFTEYDIDLNIYSTDYDFEYIFSDLIGTFLDASGKYIINKEVQLFAQNRDAIGNWELGKELKAEKTDDTGLVRFEYPSGYYALSIKDSLGQKNIFWNTKINNRTRTEKEFRTNLTRVVIKDTNGTAKKKGTGFAVYDMVADENGYFYKNKKKKDFELGADGVKDLQLASGSYLITHTNNKVTYGQAIYTENGKLQNVIFATQPGYEIKSGQAFKLAVPSIYGLAEKLKGYILLQVESRGEAWYVDNESRRRYYMKDGQSAYEMMRYFGLGITNADLEKIPVGIDERFETFDYDGDNVFDKMEEAVGTDMYMHDTDGDGFEDGVELVNGYNPNGAGKINLDLNLRDRLKGRILLQVESRGEAWYVNPEDGRRYYMPDGEAAYEIMRFLSLGITNENLEQIEEDIVPGMN